MASDLLAMASNFWVLVRRSMNTRVISAYGLSKVRAQFLLFYVKSWLIEFEDKVGDISDYVCARDFRISNH
ncbi:hypothetical protein MTR_6g052193 [Medicago truncatula]|uniref:Uncharacterized protein n=1 Tax=Medicago truncatula TaxID=3880 RepID=A0A072UA61_MEDTR|nr:hypothetical protein MTR_6g052193 [Medicago truncatula]